MSKPEIEFSPAANWEWIPIPGKVVGLSERILANDPKAGVATRMLRFAPGTDTSPNGTLTHDFWEEVYIIEGAIYDTRLKQNFTAGMFACRPPGMKHGPWISKNGCITYEVRYYSR